MKTPRQKLDEKCLKVWAEIVKLKQTCAVTGKKQSSLNPITFHAHHIISRRYSAGRYSIDNGLCLSGVHFIEKVNPEKLRDMIINAIGKDAYNDRKARYMRTCKLTMTDLGCIYLGLKEELRMLKELKNE